jgi:Glu-tRNA(Gln) amidotransferase subunit E-like FAD-binding protein
MREVLRAVRDGLLAREGIQDVLERCAEEGGFSREMLPAPCSGQELSAVIEECSGTLSGVLLRHPEKALQVLMGMIMNRVRGRCEGRLVAWRVGTRVPEAQP